MLGTRWRHRHQRHLFDLVRTETVALQVDIDHELVMSAKGVDGDLLAEQVARIFDAPPLSTYRPGQVSLWFRYCRLPL